jgi:Domain of unknown function (DUF4349)
MERSSDHGDLAAVLAEVRPTPRAVFTEELDERVTAGFPRRSRVDGTSLRSVAEWIRGLSPQRLLFAGATGALAAIAIATVIVTNADMGSDPIALDSRPETSQSSVHGGQRRLALPAAGVQYSDAVPGPTRSQESSAVGSEQASATPSAEGSGEVQSSDSVPLAKQGPEVLSPARRRDIERSAEIGLLAEPADLAEDSSKVFAAIHDADGIVLHSTTTSGANAGARFDLLIPSAKLGDALAALSAIDEVRSRHEATDDITAPTVSAREELQDSQARIDALLAQLSAAETESEAEAVEIELRSERRHATRLRARLANLDQRTAYSRVSVLIASDASADSGGAWGFDDAISDAGRVLAVAAGVTVVGLAVLAPLALVAFLTWLTHRLWLRTRRERALDA